MRHTLIEDLKPGARGVHFAVAQKGALMYVAQMSYIYYPMREAARFRFVYVSFGEGALAK